MEEILVDVGVHSGGRLERVVGDLERGLLSAILKDCITRQHGGNVEDDGGLFEGERVLGRRFVGEGVEPIPGGESWLVGGLVLAT